MKKSKKNVGEGGVVLKVVDGQLVMDDPVFTAVLRAERKHNCRNTLEINADRVQYFKHQMSERNWPASDFVIVLLNADDVHGGPIADAIMPGFDYQEIRERGEIPFARGIVDRAWIQEGLNIIDKEAGVKLQGMTDLAVVIFDHGVAEVFPA